MVTQDEIARSTSFNVIRVYSFATYKDTKKEMITEGILQKQLFLKKKESFY